MRTSISLCSSVALRGAGAPDWVHLLPTGEIRTADGRGPYRVRDNAALIRTSIGAGKLPLDENHSTDLAAPSGGPSPARGWIVQLEQRADGIWGRVQWTTEGRRIMADQQYRGVSPVIAHDAAGNVSAILRASLTNLPNFGGLTSLHSQSAKAEEARAFRAEMLRLLKLDSGASTDVIVAAVRRALSSHPVSVAALLNDTPRTELDATDRQVIKAMGLDEGQYVAALRAASSNRDEVSQHAAVSHVMHTSAAEDNVIRMMGLDREAFMRAR